MLIAVDGINGSGKTTQSKLLTKRLRREFPTCSAHLLVNPGVCVAHPAYEKIRPLARYGEWKHPMTRMMLYQAARCELIQRIRDLDGPGVFVVADRYTADYYAYGMSSFVASAVLEGYVAAGTAARRARENIARLLSMCGAVDPDVGIFSPEVAMKRWQQVSGSNPDVYESEGLDKMRELDRVYIDMSAMSSAPRDYPFTGKQRFAAIRAVVDVESPEVVHESIWTLLRKHIPSRP